MNLRITVLVLAAVGSVAVSQTTLLVPGQYPTIQSAITAAANGDTVLVAPGTYSGTVNFNGKAVSVVSSGGPVVTTIAGSGGTRVVTFSTNEGPASILQGFTVTGGAGGVLCLNASPAIIDCTVSGNVTYTDFGGGIKILATTGTASPAVTNSRITGNLAVGGGGIYAESQMVSAVCAPTLTSCEVSANAALGNGGINFGGGAAFKRSAGSNSPVLDGCVIDGNTNVYGSGGGVGFWGTNSSLMRGCRITNNTAYGNGIGGGVSNSGSQLTLSGCLIAGNNCPLGGGLGTDTGGGGGTTTMTNCTLVSNTASLGGAIWNFTNVVIVTNCIVWGNTGLAVYFPSNGTVLVSYSDVQDGLFGSNPSNKSVDPLFADAANGDTHLATNSPCVNTGTNGASGLPLNDLDGTARIQGGTVDMGADEVPVITYSGTPDGLDLYARVNGVGDPLASNRPAVTGDLLTITLKSSTGSLVGGLPLFAARLYFTGNSFPVPGGGIWLDSQSVLVYGALTAPPFGFPGLPADGLEFSFTVPAGIAGHTVRMQGLVSSVNASNGIYATSNATEVTF